MNLWTGMLCVVVLFFGLAVQASYDAPQGTEADFYVATNGNDAWSGQLPAPNAAGTDGPFATPARARDALRELKAKQGLHRPMRVLVRGGVYYLPETLTFGPEDSGTADFPITYTAYPGERPVLSGGRKLSGWQPWRGSIMQCDLKALGLTGLRCRELYYNGKLQPLARVPNADPERPLTGGFLGVFQGGNQESKRELRYNPARLDPGKWSRPTEAEVMVIPYHNWNMNTIRVASVDPAAGILTLAEDALYTLGWDTRFYVRNVLEELDAPGEWYLDEATDTLYFWPPDSGPEQAEVVAPTLSSVVNFGGEGQAPVAYVKLGGMTVRECRETAVLLIAAEHCTLARCDVTGTGSLGIALLGSANHNQVVGNDVGYVGEDGIQVSGHDNTVSNNWVHHTQLLGSGSWAALLAGGTANRVTHNLIHDTPYFGLSFGGHDNLIEFNEIHHPARASNLGGGIYSYGSPVTRNVIRFNRIYDVEGWGMPRPEVWEPNPGVGIWLDDWVSETTVYGNLVLRCTLGGGLIHGGTLNVFENNLFPTGVAGDINHLRPAGDKTQNTCRGNIIAYANLDPSHLTTLFGWTAQGTVDYVTGERAMPLFLCGWSKPGEDAMVESNYNLLFPLREADLSVFFHGQQGSAEGGLVPEKPEGRFAWWKSFGWEADSLTGDPLFVDAAAGNFTLRPESPALKLGFQQIPWQEIGLQPGPNRASWPVEHLNLPREERVGPQY